jgi:hypothetical protein
MTDRELMQMALDMLDDINQCSLPPTGIPLPAEIDHVMEALRARLAQPEREWVNLTDDEIRIAWGPYFSRGVDVARVIEALLKKRNT